MWGTKRIRKGALALLLCAAGAIAAAGCGGGSGAAQTSAESANQGSPKLEAKFRKQVDLACLTIQHRFAEANWDGGAITAQGAMGISGMKTLHPPASLAGGYSRLLNDLKQREFARSFVVVGPSTPTYSRRVHEYRLYTTRAEADARKLGLRHCPFPLAPPGHSVVEPKS